MIYNIKQDFIKRTQKALAGNEKLFQNDAVPRHDYVTEFISKQIKPEHDVLEIGCGYGRWSSLIHAKSYTEVDMTKDRIDYARQNYRRRKTYLGV